MGRNLIIFNNNYNIGRLIADSFRNKALTGKYIVLLRLLYTVSSNLASLRTEAKSTFFLKGGGMLWDTPVIPYIRLPISTNLAIKD